jgi:hypothetical protein
MSFRKFRTKLAALDKSLKHYLYGMVLSLSVILVILPLFPNFSPYATINGFWFIKGSVFQWIITSQYIFYVAIFWGFIGVFISYKRIQKPSPSLVFKVLLRDFKTSVYAGFIEEVSYRWIIFLGTMLILYVCNWLLGGFLGENNGIIQWIHTVIASPLINLITLDYLVGQINHEYWYAGASVIVTNGMFAYAHANVNVKYDTLTVINSWFMGMFFFYTMFQYGLFAAIIVHTMYNVLHHSSKMLAILIKVKFQRPVRKDLF